MALETTILTDCPGDAEFVALLEGRLPAPATARLEQHLATCAVCRALVEVLSKGDASLSVALSAALGATVGQRSAIGRYRVLSMIGRGGMGEVHAAYDPELDRRVALKLLHTAQSSDGARRRLLREARALGKLSHPNVVQVYDVGEHDGDVFVAMELVEGMAFDVWCRSVPAPSWQAVLAAYLDAARGLSAAHDKGLVHRDVKPSNILRGADGRVRVVDFGLAVDDEGSVEAESGPQLRTSAGVTPEGDASSLEAGPPVDATLTRLAVASTLPAGSGPERRRAERLTATGAILGTPLYMAPEQYETSRASPASDQYSLCTALHEGLYGVLPFATGDDTAGRLGEMRVRKMEGAIPPPPVHSPVPAWVHRALVRGLAPRPEDRYPSLPALIAALSDDPEPERSRRPRASGLGPRSVPRALLEPAGRVPRPLTPLVGRADERREISERVGTSRLLTLTGAGGVGKSRLALQVASDRQGDFAGGAWFVELAPLADPELVLPTVASALGVHEVPGRALFEMLVTALRGRPVFLVLDNCEHLLDAASRLAEGLLHACAELRILVTSRQSLGLTGEVAWRVPSLVTAEAVALFHERAGQKDDPATVAQICQRLDGIPLAIELAAARTRVLSVAQIAARLDDRFRLLTDGSRSALPRHRTLKAAVDWGYQLLTEAEQALLCRLSVFAGGCTLEAVEAVAGGDVLDPLSNLVDKSLVTFSGRYRLLETVRQYAAERLAERAETEDARTRHLAYFLALAEEAEPHVFGGDVGCGWIDRLSEDNDNLRAAFDFCQADERRAESALRLTAALHWYWFTRVHLREGQARTLAALRRKELASPRVRARALTAAGYAAMWIGDDATMPALGPEILALVHQLDDNELCAYALCGLGAAAVNRGANKAARPLLGQAVARARAQGNRRLLIFILYWLGTAEHGERDLSAARATLEEALVLARRDTYGAGIGHTLFRIGEVAESSGNHDEARRCYLESLRTLAEAIDRWGVAQVLDALGRIAVINGQPERAARLLGAVEALCELTGARILASDRQHHAADTARRVLGEEAFAAAWADGRALGMNEAVAFAQADPSGG